MFGGNFLQRLRIKYRKRETLRGVTLIDSPGMIDSAEQTVDRAYNFEGVVRTLAELCDMVFFLLDPDKPGTTGETVNVFASCLRGVEFKLRVLLNKADTFDSMEDYARAYGTLCWNLARVLRTKDLPPVFSTYTPSTGARLAARVPLESFERHRGQLLELLRSTDLPVEAVSQQLGFGSSAYFRRVLRRFTDCTPRQIRRGMNGAI